MKKQAIAMIVFAVVAVMTAQAGSVIGMAVSNGQMQVDRSQVTGNANLSEGSTVKTGSEPSRIQLTNGRRAMLAPGSAAQVYADRLVLESGLSLVATPAYKLQAGGFEVVAAASDAQAQVMVKGGVVQVAALNGPVKVRDGAGMVVAKVNAGSALDLTPGTKGDATSTMTGVLRQESGKFMMKDGLTNLDVELRGANLSGEVGRAVAVTGRASASGDRESQVIEVARLTRVEADPQSGGAKPTSGDSKKPSGGTGGGSGGGSAPKTSAGMSSGAKIAIALVIAGGGAGAAIALTQMSR